ncbi:MAG: FeoA domain-containing protein [Lachnospiraceae bacterium]|nr:FeoA domain-containing protein [Lachnospiraceae bacterium]
MKLYEGTVGQTYIVRSVVVDDTITRRLEALGVNELTPVTILNKKGSGSVILKVRGTRLAVGRRISEGIQIEETDQNRKER